VHKAVVDEYDYQAGAGIHSEWRYADADDSLYYRRLKMKFGPFEVYQFCLPAEHPTLAK
jgi:hypothetical protein